MKSIIPVRVPLKVLLSVPLVAVVGLSAVLALGLQRDPRELPSPLIGRLAPAFRLPLLDQPTRAFAPEDERGQVWLLNVWASWCVACRAEHDVLLALSREHGLPVYGLDYKDEAAPALAYLARHGNPYRAILEDAERRVGIDYGVYGVPETYVIDARGVIRYKHVGALTTTLVEEDILPLAGRLRRLP